MGQSGSFGVAADSSFAAIMAHFLEVSFGDRFLLASSGVL
jgi:hypothetical protein